LITAPDHTSCTAVPAMTGKLAELRALVLNGIRQKEKAVNQDPPTKSTRKRVHKLVVTCVC
jgi:hypothetical protein